MSFIASPQIASEQFLMQSAGKWHSQRRYYTLNTDSEPLEATSEIEVIFLPADHPELNTVHKLHSLSPNEPFQCGAKVTWHSIYTNIERKPLIGTTIFGIRDSRMYRDRGFSTHQPIIAHLELPQPNIMRLQTAYDGSSFEEEIKLIGTKHRTRQTIISKAGTEIMIGQYLETRW